MSTSPLERLRDAHREPAPETQPRLCPVDAELWPCDVALVLAIVDAVRPDLEERDKLRMVIRNAIDNIAHNRYGHAIRQLRAGRDLFEPKP